MSDPRNPHRRTMNAPPPPASCLRLFVLGGALLLLGAGVAVASPAGDPFFPERRQAARELLLLFANVGSTLAMAGMVARNGRLAIGGSAVVLAGCFMMARQAWFLTPVAALILFGAVAWHAAQPRPPPSLPEPGAGMAPFPRQGP